MWLHHHHRSALPTAGTVETLLVVLTPPVSADLTTLDAVKLDLGSTNAADDTYLTDQIAKASAAIAAWVDRTFGRRQVAQTCRLHAHVEKLRLQQRPVGEIVSVVADGAALTADDYEFDADTGEFWSLRNDHRVPWTARKVVITYWGGWLLPQDQGRDLPLDVEEACIELVRGRYAVRGRDPNLRSDATEGVGSSTYFDPQRSGGALPDSIADSLRHYSRTPL